MGPALVHPSQLPPLHPPHQCHAGKGKSKKNLQHIFSLPSIVVMREDIKEGGSMSGSKRAGSFLGPSSLSSLLGMWRMELSSEEKEEVKCCTEETTSPLRHLPPFPHLTRSTSSRRKRMMTKEKGQQQGQGQGQGQGSETNPRKDTTTVPSTVVPRQKSRFLHLYYSYGRPQREVKRKKRWPNFL
jgi:hypothetical protein